MCVLETEYTGSLSSVFTSILIQLMEGEERENPAAQHIG